MRAADQQWRHRHRRQPLHSRHLCEGETITRIDRNIAAAARRRGHRRRPGKHVFPGFIDPHVHIYLPFMGTFSKDTHETGSKAALVGGTTTIYRDGLPGAERRRSPRVFELWHRQGRGQGLPATSRSTWASRGSTPTSDAQLREIVKRGIGSFKIFLAYKGAFGVDDEELWQTLRARQATRRDRHRPLRERDARRRTPAAAARRRQDRPRGASRQPPAAGRGRRRASPDDVRRARRRPRLHRPPLLRGVAEAAVAARLRGVNVSVETLIQYLVLDKTCAEQPDFEGAKYVMSPPLRDRTTRRCSGTASRSGVVQHRRRPTTPPSTSPRRSRWARTTSPRFPTASRRSKTASTCSAPTA